MQKAAFEKEVQMKKTFLPAMKTVEELQAFQLKDLKSTYKSSP